MIVMFTVIIIITAVTLFCSDHTKFCVICAYTPCYFNLAIHAYSIVFSERLQSEQLFDFMIYASAIANCYKFLDQ